MHLGFNKKNTSDTLLTNVPSVVLILLLSLIGSVSAQIKQQLYYTIRTNGVVQLSIKQDTLAYKKCINYDYCDIPENASLIVKSVEKGSDQYLISKFIGTANVNAEKFYLTVLRYDKDDDYLQVVSENYSYNSIAECEVVISNYDLRSKFHFTLYTIKDLHKFETLRHLSSFTNEEEKKVYKKLTDLLIENKPLILNTRTGGMYGSTIEQEVVVRALIACNINPFVSEDDLDEFIKRHMTGKQ